MKILKNLFIGILALVALLAIIGLMLPSTVHLERSAIIAAPQSTVFTLVNGYARLNDWSPWAKIDPATEYAYEGPAEGVGAKVSWVSEHPDVGSGSQEITASEPYRRVETHLDFGPQGTAEAFFDLAAEGAGTKVVWGFDSDFGYNLIGRYFGLMMESMLGPNYEDGLANLQQLAESLPQVDFSDLAAEMTEVESVPIAWYSGTSSQEPEAIHEAFTAAYGEIGSFIGKHQLAPAGRPITINTSWDENGFAFDAAIPIAAAPEGDVPDGGEVHIGQTFGGKVLKTVHTGPYTEMESTYEKIEAYLAARGLEAVDRPWDEWVSDPAETPANELITHTYFPIE